LAAPARATESLLTARQAYQVLETGQRLESGQKLAEADLLTVHHRLYQAAVRPAMVLNEAFAVD